MEGGSTDNQQQKRMRSLVVKMIYHFGQRNRSCRPTFAGDCTYKSGVRRVVNLKLIESERRTKRSDFPCYFIGNVRVRNCRSFQALPTTAAECTFSTNLVNLGLGTREGNGSGYRKTRALSLCLHCSVEVQVGRYYRTK